MEGHNHTDGVVLDMLIEDLKAAIVPDWRPASEPLLDEREVIVLCRDGSTVIDYKINGLRWSWVSDSDAVAWHEIEVPEPPEVQ
jgi:hypothetical protein